MNLPEMDSEAQESRATLIAGIVRWVQRLVPDGDRADRLAQDLQSATWDADDHGDRGAITEQTVRAVEAVCHRTARHLTLELTTPGRPDVEAAGWPPVPQQVVQRRAGFVSRVERYPSGCGLFRIDGFDDITVAAEYLHGAFAVLRGVDGLILDLRGNGGGAPSSLAAVAEFVLGNGIELLSTVRYRDRPDRQWWTSGSLGSWHLPTAAPVAVLVASGTYSSGEALAFHLQTRGRVRLFGQLTPGAADHVTPIRVTPSVVALIPEGTPLDSVSGSNWEGTGVVPDVTCPPDQAEDTAMAWLTTQVS